MENIIKVAKMPGTVKEVAITGEESIQEVIALADHTVDNYEVKVDGVVVTDLTQPVGDAGMILLAKKVKGN